MRLLLLSLLTICWAALPGQCVIEAEIFTATCSDADDSVVLTFSVDGGSGPLWFSPQLNMEGQYSGDEIITFSVPNIVAGQTIFFFDQQFQDSCFTTAVVPEIECDDPCFNFDVFIDQEGGICGNDNPETFWFLTFTSNSYPIEIEVFNGNGTLYTSGTIASPNNSFTLETFDGEIKELRATNENGCVLDTFLIPNIFECGSITGRSWLDEDRDGLQGPQENVAVSATLSLLSQSGQVVAVTTTDPNGVYVFSDLEPFRNYRVRIDNNVDSLGITTTLGGVEELDNDFFADDRTTNPVFLEEGETETLDAGWVTDPCENFSASVELIHIADACGENLLLIEVQGGTQPVQAQIFNSIFGNPIFDFTVLSSEELLLGDTPPGVYLLQLTDANGCAQLLEFVIDQSAGGLDVNIVENGNLCIDGAVTLIAEIEGDATGAAYLWSNGATTQAITVEEGNQVFAVEVTSLEGCTGQDQIWVSATFTDTIDVPQRVILQCGEDENATVSVNNPIPGAVYTWFGPENTILTGTTVEISIPGFYEVVLESETGCEGFGFTQVIDLNLDIVDLVSFNEQDSICGLGGCFGLTNLWNFNNDLIEVEWSGPPEFQEWYETLTVQLQSFCNVQEGTYTATVRSECDTVVLIYEHEVLDCSEISGTLYLDSDGDCDLDDNDTPAPGFIITLTDDATGDMYYAWTDPNGDWAVELPNGTYTIEPVIEEGQPLESCPATSVTLAGIAVTGVNLFMPVLLECPLLSTEITIPWLRRCFTGCAYVNYENSGTATAEDAQVVVVLDPFFIDVIPSIDPVSVEGNVYTFNVGDLPPFSNGRIGFIFTVSCDSELGQSHCIDASITPDDFCHSDENWNGALVDITNVQCDGDTLIFTVSNIGDNQMSIPLSYVIVEDGIMLSEEPMVNGQLAPGEDYIVTVAADGSTYALITNQEPNAPGSEEPSIVFEGCNGEGQNFSTGFSNLLPLASGNPSRSFVCRENVGSYDPNDKRGFPLGWDDGNINEGTRLDYEIRFQNTGTDTAFTVVISDTLEPSLDLATFKMEAASHDYVVTIDTHRVVTWTFNDIMLPDSNVNLLLSQGSVTFSIDHDESLVPGDVILNEAAIYFDFNEPVITNVSRHMIAKEGLPTATRSVEAQSVRLTIYPNPVADLLRVTAPEEDIRANDFLVITDLHGRPLKSKAYSQLGQGLNVSDLPAGYYLLLVNDATGRTRGRAPFVVASR